MPWRLAASETIWAAGCTATAPNLPGRCHTSRRCSTTMPSSAGSMLITTQSRSSHLPESRSRKSAQDDKWSFCLTAGTLCPSYQERPCLLYTSDAADEEDSVDLGGRRII